MPLTASAARALLSPVAGFLLLSMGPLLGSLVLLVSFPSSLSVSPGLVLSSLLPSSLLSSEGLGSSAEVSTRLSMALRRAAAASSTVACSSTDRDSSSSTRLALRRAAVKACTLSAVYREVSMALAWLIRSSRMDFSALYRWARMASSRAWATGWMSSSMASPSS